MSGFRPQPGTPLPLAAPCARWPPSRFSLLAAPRGLAVTPGSPGHLLKYRWNLLLCLEPLLALCRPLSTIPAMPDSFFLQNATLAHSCCWQACTLMGLGISPQCPSLDTLTSLSLLASSTSGPAQVSPLGEAGPASAVWGFPPTAKHPVLTLGSWLRGLGQGLAVQC